MPKKISLSQSILWVERLSILLKSGLAVSEALDVLRGSLSRGNLRNLSSALYEQVSRGQQLSLALKKFSLHGSVGSFVAIGERSGSLADVLQHAGRYMRQQDDLRGKIVAAALYPVIIGCMTVGVTSFMVWFIFPKIMPLFISMGIELPLPTRMLLFFTKFLSMHWLVICGSGISLTVLLVMIWRYLPRVRRFGESTMLACPFVGRVISDSKIASIFEMISIQMVHGSSLVSSLGAVRVIDRWLIYKDALESVAEDIDRGVSFSASLSKYGRIFSPETIGLMKVAEKSGQTPELCHQVFLGAQSRIEQAIFSLSKIAEPLLMLGMGFVVGSVALSIIMPIYEITNKINSH